MRRICSSSWTRSHPAWGAWIEIHMRSNNGSRQAGRTPHGVRGLKFSCYDYGTINRSRTPHGVRGLKSLEHDATQPSPRSEPPPKSRRPGLQMQSGASNIKGRHALPKRRDGKRAAAVAQRRKRYHERSKRDLWACTLLMRGCVQHKTNCATRKATEPQFRGFLPHLCVFVV